MNRNYILFILLIFLAGFAFYLVNNKTSTTIQGNDWKLATPKTNITKIFLVDRKGNDATLIKKNGTWFYNDQFKAKKDAIQNLLHTIENVKLKIRPSNNAIDFMVKSIANNGIKVVLFEEDKELITYYVGGTTNDERGTYMMKEDGNQPYVYYLPEHTGGLRVRYLPTPELWRDLTIFDWSPNEFPNQISFSYPGKKENDFVYENNTITSTHQTTISHSNLSQKNIQLFRQSFYQVGAESWINNPKLVDSLQQKQPFCKIQLNESVSYQFYPIPQYDSENNLILDKNKKPSIKKYYLLVDHKNLYLTQHRVFRSIFWGYDSFKG